VRVASAFETALDHHARGWASERDVLYAAASDLPGLRQRLDHPVVRAALGRPPPRLFAERYPDDRVERWALVHTQLLVATAEWLAHDHPAWDALPGGAHPHPVARRWAVRAADLRDDVEALRQATTDPDAHVRLWSLGVLTERGLADATVGDGLTALLDDPDLAPEAAALFARFRHPPARLRLEGMVAGEGLGRWTALRALVYPESVPLLRRHLLDRALSTTAAEGLLELGHVDPLVDDVVARLAHLDAAAEPQATVVPGLYTRDPAAEPEPLFAILAAASPDALAAHRDRFDAWFRRHEPRDGLTETYARLSAEVLAAFDDGPAWLVDAMADPSLARRALVGLGAAGPRALAWRHVLRDLEPRLAPAAGTALARMGATRDARDVWLDVAGWPLHHRSDPLFRFADALWPALATLDPIDDDDLAATVVALESLDLPDAAFPPNPHAQFAHLVAPTTLAAWRRSAAWLRARYAELGVHSGDDGGPPCAPHP
jgi:hypothetical protein